MIGRTLHRLCSFYCAVRAAAAAARIQARAPEPVQKLIISGIRIGLRTKSRDGRVGTPRPFVEEKGECVFHVHARRSAVH